MIDDTKKNIDKIQPKSNSIESKRYFKLYMGVRKCNYNDSISESEPEQNLKEKLSVKRVRFSKTKLICKDNYNT